MLSGSGESESSEFELNNYQFPKIFYGKIPDPIILGQHEDTRWLNLDVGISSVHQGLNLKLFSEDGVICSKCRFHFNYRNKQCFIEKMIFWIDYHLPVMSWILQGHVGEASTFVVIFKQSLNRTHISQKKKCAALKCSLPRTFNAAHRYLTKQLHDQDCSTNISIALFKS